MASRINTWIEQLPAEMLEPLGYAAGEMDRQSPEMRALLLESWLEADPLADVALASARYVQQDLIAGDVSQATVVGILPTENVLVRVELTGEQLLEVLTSRRPLVAGLTETEDGYTLPSGAPLDPLATYQVLLPDTLYLGGNYYDVAALRSHADLHRDRLARSDACQAPVVADKPRPPAGDRSRRRRLATHALHRHGPYMPAGAVGRLLVERPEDAQSSARRASPWIRYFSPVSATRPSASCARRPSLRRACSRGWHGRPGSGLALEAKGSSGARRTRRASGRCRDPESSQRSCGR